MLLSGEPARPADRRRRSELIGQLLDNPAYLRAADDDRAAERFGWPRGETLPTFRAGGLRPRRDGRPASRAGWSSCRRSRRSTDFRWCWPRRRRDVRARRSLGMFLGGLDARAVPRGGRPRDPRRPRSRRGRADGDRSRAPEDAAGLRGDRAAVGRARRSTSARSSSEGRRLFYRRDGVATPIARIYNRVIPDELERNPAGRCRSTTATTSTSSGPAGRTGSSASASSRFRGCGTRGCRRRTTSATSAACRADREEWLLKPLFSFAGGGIIFAPTDARHRRDSRRTQRAALRAAGARGLHAGDRHAARHRRRPRSASCSCATATPIAR